MLIMCKKCGKFEHDDRFKHCYICAFDERMEKIQKNKSRSKEQGEGHEEQNSIN